MSPVENIKTVPKNILEQVSGVNIENRLTDLAVIGGVKLPSTPEQPVRYAVSRLAFSPDDITARKFLEAQMIEAGMSVTQEMFATIGLYEGTDPKLKFVFIISHHDSVPNGGMYDGVVGVNTGIEVINILHRNNIKYPHSIVLISCTEEESSRFSTGLGGSKGLTQGLTDAELDQTDKKVSKRVALETLGFDPQQAKNPSTLFSQENSALASIELHVEQNTRLADSNIELGVIEAIAAPIRYRIIIGDLKQSSSEIKETSNDTYYNININGKSGHSGATPMEPGVRADALVAQSEILIHLNVLQNSLQKENSDIQISIGDMVVNNDASINKIPGSSSLSLKISGKDTQKIAELTKKIQDYINQRNQRLSKKSSNFGQQPISLKKIDKPDCDFSKSEEVLRYFSLAGYFIKSVQSITTLHRNKNTVGTVGTFQFKNGQITMDVDLRGIDKTDRDAAAAKIDDIMAILAKADKITNNLNLPYEKKEIAGGSGDPTLMDPRLVRLAQKVIEENKIGSYATTFSPAGHDTQNIARVGIPIVMLFIPSRNNGAAHTPDEYSTPKDLENGAKALLSLVHTLASNPTDIL